MVGPAHDFNKRPFHRGPSFILEAVDQCWKIFRLGNNYVAHETGAWITPCPQTCMNSVLEDTT